MENVSSYIMFFIIVKFPVNKEELIYWKKNPSVVFPVLFRRIWMPSRLCCCRTVFTLHVFASSMGTSACSDSASAFHFIYTRLERHLLDRPQRVVGITLCSDIFWLNLTSSTSILQEITSDRALADRSWSHGSRISVERFWRKRKSDIFKGFFCWVLMSRFFSSVVIM